MFSWTRTQNPPSEPHAGSTKPLTPNPAIAVAEPVEPPAPEPDGSAPTRRFTDAVAPCATRLGSLQIRGTLTGSDSVELSGRFDGPINVEGLCRVNAGGHVIGDLTAGDAVIAGDIQGRLTVIGRLELGGHARVISDIEAGTIAIAEGCFIEGRIHMRGSAAGSQPVSFKEKRRGKRRKRQPPAAAEGSVEAPPVTTGLPTAPEPVQTSSEARGPEEPSSKS